MLCKYSQVQGMLNDMTDFPALRVEDVFRKTARLPKKGGRSGFETDWTPGQSHLVFPTTNQAQEMSKSFTSQNF
jgi:hypothetical protein